ncbi:MAG: hypothetical protein MJ050_08665 [Phascolarctobacterium sp.]|nr:hypothetical protein [Phascolarctobacterium sp.]
MMNFDFTPVVQKQGAKIVKGLFIMCVPVVILSFFISRPFGMTFLQGTVLGIMDTLIMFRGINKALPYADNPQKGLAVMRRYRWYRLIAVSSIIVMLLKQNAEMLGAFFGILLTHIFLLIQLTFIAYNLNRKDT